MTKRSAARRFSAPKGLSQTAMAINFSEESIKIILDTLKANTIEDIISRDLPDLDEELDIDRERAELYARRGRGSVRLKRGLFYTVKEFAERQRKVAALSLP
jgi:Holliday junction resolvasome RuvABC ATP-dependent DNA helicase subunit